MESSATNERGLHAKRVRAGKAIFCGKVKRSKKEQEERDAKDEIEEDAPDNEVDESGRACRQKGWWKRGDVEANVRIRPPDCEDTPCRHHATTTPYDPSPPRRTTTHDMTQLKTLRSPIVLYSKSVNCNLGIFLIFFLIRLRYRPFSIGKNISHVLWPLALEPEFL